MARLYSLMQFRVVLLMFFINFNFIPKLIFMGDINNNQILSFTKASTHQNRRPRLRKIQRKTKLLLPRNKNVKKDVYPLTAPTLLQYVPDKQGTGLEGSAHVNPVGQGRQTDDALSLQVPIYGQ